MLNSHLILLAARVEEQRSSTPADRGHVFAVPKVREVRSAPAVDEPGLW